MYRVEEYIEKCLRSIINSEPFAKYCELIVVDDGSPDASAAVAERACDGRSNTKIVRSVNSGPGGARNTGAALAQGEYIWFVDSDDWLPDDAISTVVSFLESNSLDILNLDYITSQGLKCASTAIEPRVPYRGVDYLNATIVQTPVQYYIHRRSFYLEKRLAFCAHIYHEDTLFTPVSLYQAERIMRLDTPCYVYNVREGSIMTGGSILKHFADMRLVFAQLHLFCDERVVNDFDKRTFAKYVALCTGGLFYYWRKMPAAQQRIEVRKLDLVLLAKYVIRARLFKYLSALLLFGVARALDYVKR